MECSAGESEAGAEGEDDSGEEEEEVEEADGPRTALRRVYPLVHLWTADVVRTVFAKYKLFLIRFPHN